MNTTATCLSSAILVLGTLAIFPAASADPYCLPGNDNCFTCSTTPRYCDGGVCYWPAGLCVSFCDDVTPLACAASPVLSRVTCSDLPFPDVRVCVPHPAAGSVATPAPPTLP